MAERKTSSTGTMQSPEAALGFLLNQAADVVRERTAAALAPLGLHPRLLGLLLAVHDRPGITQTECSHRLRIDRTTMSQLVNELVSRKILRRTVAVTDRRQQHLHLTAEGGRTVRRAAAAATRAEREVTAHIASAELDRLAATLIKLLPTVTRSNQ